MGTQIERFKDSAKRAREKTQRAEQTLIRKATLSATGAGLAYAVKKGMTVEVFGVPTKLWIAAGGAIGEIVARGAVARFFGAVSDASLAVYSFKAVETGNVIAGLEGVGEEI